MKNKNTQNQRVAKKSKKFGSVLPSQNFLLYDRNKKYFLKQGTIFLRAVFLLLGGKNDK